MSESLEARMYHYQQDKEYHRTPLIWAGRNQEANVIRFILVGMSQREREQELSRLDDWGYTALHWACAVKLDPDLSAMRALLELGANPNARSDEGWFSGETPLLKAIQSANPRAVQLLLDWGAQVGPDELETAESYGLLAITQMLRSQE